MNLQKVITMTTFKKIINKHVFKKIIQMTIEFIYSVVTDF